MYLCKLLIIISCHSSLAILQFPYPKQTLELPNHPSNWVCTVHNTVATFADYISSDITERFLASNREKIIPTVGTMINRSISISPVNSFFEPCTISVLIDATVGGSSYVFERPRLDTYFSGNEYVYRGWKHSIIILIYFSCYSAYSQMNLRLPHRLFYHSLDCGHPYKFPNQAFVSHPMQTLWNIDDPTHSIHYRQLPLAMRRSISTPKYHWDSHNAKIKPEQCLASRWDYFSQMSPCDFNKFAVQHYRVFLNFTTVANTAVGVPNNGEVITNSKWYGVKDSISWHIVDSTNSRALYCDRNSDSPRLRPIRLPSPLTFETWVMLVVLLMLCAIACSFNISDGRSAVMNWTPIIFIKTIFNSLFELIMCLVEKDVGKQNCAKAFIGLLVICLGNDYKNHLTIELVYPRAGGAIHNLTELLDLNFNVLSRVNFEHTDIDKSTWLKGINYHLEIDEAKRERYVNEVERWWKLLWDSDEKIINELASVTSKNAYIVSFPYYMQVYYLSLVSGVNYPLSCHFVKRPFAHEFSEFYFFNPKAEEFKMWTEKFLGHGLFEFWKRLHGHMLSLHRHQFSLVIRSKRSNSSSVEALDVQNFIGQVHLIVFYIVIAILTAICVVIFLLECVMQNAQALVLIVLNKFKHYSLQLLRTIVRSLSLMRKLIGRFRQNRNASKMTLKRTGFDAISFTKIHKIEVKPQQQ
jgi:hypothetical protein